VAMRERCNTRQLPRNLIAALAAPLLVLLISSSSKAIDLNGMWATDTAQCEKVFVVKGGKASFQRNSGVYGNGFIIEGKRIRGPNASCTRTRTSENNETIHLMASCATDIMYSNVQFTLKVLGDDRVDRIFPGFDGMEVSYFRCPADGQAAKPIPRRAPR
jgi:hypothetical protein